MRRRGKGEGRARERAGDDARPLPSRQGSAAAPQRRRVLINKDTARTTQDNDKDTAGTSARTKQGHKDTAEQHPHNKHGAAATRQDTPAPPGPPRTGHGQASDAAAQPPDARGQRRSAALLTLSAAADAPPRPDRPAGARGATTPRPPRGPAVARHCDSRRACAAFWGVLRTPAVGRATRQPGCTAPPSVPRPSPFAPHGPPL